jgi:hypothetical protein
VATGAAPLPRPPAYVESVWSLLEREGGPKLPAAAPTVEGAVALRDGEERLGGTVAL